MAEQDRAADGGDGRGTQPRKDSGSQRAGVMQKLREASGVHSQVLLRDISDEQAPPISPIATELGTSLIGTSRYHVVGEIARGGVGRIWKVRDQDLGRDIAMKVLLERHAEKHEVVQRFIEEAQIGGQLQHPGIVPVYELGLLADKRPYFTMNLVKGRTLSEMLLARSHPSSERQRFIASFERICQAIAYAHARGVVHRDLKPSNIMVGSYGEVKVVDWGFAKILPRGGVEDERRTREQTSVVSVIESIRSQGGEGSHSIAGSVLGTPAYMPPEQAMGNVDRLDERSDVFCLGGILCEILTGAPPYLGSPEEQITKALQADLRDARHRVDTCGADRELIDLARELLEPGRTLRPANAGIVAQRVASYLASVEERIRRAEVAEVEARAQADKAHMKALEQKRRAEEERRRRLLVMGLAGAVLMCFLIGGGAWNMVRESAREQLASTTRAVTAALEDAQRLGGLARAGEGDVLARWNEAIAAAERAQAVARAGEADPELHARVERSLASLRTDRAQTLDARRRRQLDERTVQALAAVRAASGDPLEAQSTHAAYLVAFSGYGIDLTKGDRSAVSAALASSAILPALVEALDDWSWVRSRLPSGQAPTVTGLRAVAGLLDPEPQGRELRAAIGTGAVRQLTLLAGRTDLGEWAATTLRLLANALGYAGEVDRAVHVLRTSRSSHPGDAWTHFDLAYWLTQLDAPDWEEAVEYYTAAVALRPDAVCAWNNLGSALLELGRPEQAREALAKAVALRPDYARAQLNLGIALRRCGDEHAQQAFERAIELKPDYALAWHHLGLLHRDAQRTDDALRALCRACELDGNFRVAHQDLVELMLSSGRTDEALEFCGTAEKRSPQAAWVQHTLGYALLRKGDMPAALVRFRRAAELDAANSALWQDIGGVLVRIGRTEEAITAYERAVEVDPLDANAQYNLGWMRAGIADERRAEQHYRRAVELDPSLAAAWDDLGSLLRLLGNDPQALECFRKAIAASPRMYQAHYNLGYLLGSRRTVPEALAAYRDVVKEVPDDRPCGFWVGLSSALLTRGRFDESLKAALQAVASPGAVTDCYVNLGRVIGWIEDSREGALLRYRQAVPDARVVPDAYFLAGLAQALGSRGLLEDQLRCYRDAAGFLPETAWPDRYVGTALEVLGRYEDAERAMLLAISKEPFDLDSYGILGRVTARRGGREAAEKTWTERFDGGDAIYLAQYFNGAGRGCELRGEPEEALALLSRASEAVREFPQPHYQRAHVLRGLGRIDEALEACLLAIRLHSGVRAYHQLLGELLGLRLSGAEALARYCGETGLDPCAAHGFFHIGLATALRERGEAQQARRLLEQATRLDPEPNEAWFHLGWVLELEGRSDEAWDAYEEAANLRPLDGHNQAHRCRMRAASGRYPDAVAEGRAAVRANAGNIEAHLVLARVLMHERQFAEAIRTLETAAAPELPGWAAPFRPRIEALRRACEGAVALGERLDDTVRGQRKPQSDAEALDWACLALATDHFATATRLFDGAFEGGGGAEHRFDAACAALLASQGRGDGAEKFGESTRRKWLARAVEWLGADWDTHRREYEEDPVKGRPALVTILDWYRVEERLDALRSPELLATLTESERTTVDRIWKEVARFAARAVVPD